MLFATLLAHALIADPAVAIVVTGEAGVDTGAGQTPLARFDEVPEGGTVVTGPDSFVQLRLSSGSLVKLGPETRIDLTRLEQRSPRGKRRETIRLRVGRIWAQVTDLFGSDSSFEVETNNAVAGVRGTSFFAQQDESDARFVLTGGRLELKRGERHMVLDQIGGFVDVTPDAFGAPGVLPSAQLAGLFGEIGGPGGGATARLQNTQIWPPPAAAANAAGPSARDDMREEIVGPDAVVDTLLGGGQQLVDAFPEVHLRIRLELPPEQ